VLIDRNTGLIAVRPLRRHRTYELPLSAVATFICQSVIRAEAHEKRKQKAEARKARRG
jgi:hypothetical protein